MPQKTLHGLKRIKNATRYSFQGLKAAFQNEPAFREEVVLAAVMIPIACWLDVTQIDRILLIATVVLVLIAELFNSAIEAVVDRIGEEQHELAGRAKDIGSAAVMITMLLTGYVWLEVLFL
ncbi:MULTISPECIES: diacylglycerol kinase [Vibrio]|uniref:Diacylglycerol kinase n=1 Tax=Vibrio neptunius TaxID=170651 RepID=A0ABS3A9S9_9VIBR|nr:MULTISPECIES: diacylglycerol kinase [unclassified Vibrio]MBN3495069.1 diacylglycerol kinase [Vibrio neptunius]MBN3517569.1 diacylglycerol kinase [Vibrio neptunius]MBN3551906.1 diacylglycerol kinase [Vibrio neptunius]MBN3579914.1 diacylglycerol kinase [Vibrio neptunius]MCH9873580.1 diacylglycerol kinase [Vibrio neptunius]